MRRSEPPRRHEDPFQERLFWCVCGGAAAAARSRQRSWHTGGVRNRHEGTKPRRSCVKRIFFVSSCLPGVPRHAPLSCCDDRGGARQAPPTWGGKSLGKKFLRVFVSSWRLCDAPLSRCDDRGGARQAPPTSGGKILGKNFLRVFVSSCLRGVPATRRIALRGSRWRRAAPPTWGRADSWKEFLRVFVSSWRPCDAPRSCGVDRDGAGQAPPTWGGKILGKKFLRVFVASAVTRRYRAARIAAARLMAAASAAT
jgi:hypothetical protein